MKHPSKPALFGLGGTLLLLGSTLFAPLAAHASADGRRNTTIALGAAAAYELLVRHQVAPALVLGAGAVYAGKRYEDAVHHDHNRNNRDYHRTDNRDSDNYNNDRDYNNNDRSNNDNYSYDNNRDCGRQGQRPSRDYDNRQSPDQDQQSRWGNQQGRWNTQQSRPDQTQDRDDRDSDR